MKNPKNQIHSAGAHKIALYIRVSTEEQASNPEGSIKSQEQRLRSHVLFKNQESPFGEMTAVFIDRAKSGKDTNRPELQRLLQAVRNKEVTLVMVTELSRLSRSIRDFCDIWELMRSHGCEFQSLREQFDTTNAAGEMVLFTIANIAQFERRQVAERVTANLQARSARGLYNGGILPFGYRTDTTKKGHLVVEKAEAEIIREAFAAFLKQKSLTRAASHLNKKGLRLSRITVGGGYRPRLGHFTIGNLHTILRNKAYIGVKTYRVGREVKEAKAVWEPIVDGVAFQQVQEILSANRGRKKPDTPERYPFVLAGITYCGSCGDRLSGKSAHGNAGKIPYYEHAWATKRQACLVKKVFACNPNRVLAKELEPAVWGQVQRMLSTPEVAEMLLAEALAAHERNSQVKEAGRLKEKVQAVDRQLEALAERLAELPKTVSATPIFRQMEKLEQLKTEEESRLRELGDTGETEPPAELASYRQFLAGLARIATDPKGQGVRAEIVQRLIRRVDVKPGTFCLHLHVGKNYVDRELASAGSRIVVHPGSNSLTIGWRTRIRT